MTPFWIETATESAVELGYSCSRYHSKRNLIFNFINKTLQYLVPIRPYTAYYLQLFLKNCSMQTIIYHIFIKYCNLRLSNLEFVKQIFPYNLNIIFMFHQSFHIA